MKKGIIITIIAVIALYLLFGIYKTYKFVKNPGESIAEGIENMSDKNLEKFSKQMQKICLDLQPRAIENVEKIKGCKEYSAIPLADSGNYYEIKGTVDGKCHFIKEKTVREPEFHFETLADCYIPMAEFDKAYELLLENAKKMCDDAGEENSEKAKEILLKYCENVENS